MRATSAEHGLQLIRAKRAWYLAHGIDPADFQATSDVWQRTGRAYGEPLSALDRAWARSVGLEAWRRYLV